MITVEGIPRYYHGTRYSKYFVAQLMCMLSRFDVTIAKELPMQQVACPKATTSNVGLSQLFENNFGNNRYLLEYENYSSLIGLQTSQDH